MKINKNVIKDLQCLEALHAVFFNSLEKCPRNWRKVLKNELIIIWNFRRDVQLGLCKLNDELSN